jgi:hypothetical protein
MSSSVVRYNSIYFFLLRRLKEQVYAVPLRTIEDLEAIVRGLVTTVDANMLRPVRENAVGRTAVCERTEAASNTYLTMRRPWFDRLKACAI